MVEAFVPWEIEDVTSWEAIGQETRGKRSKCWVVDPGGVRWLRKEPWGSRPFEPAVEVFALRLARVVGLPAPESRPCIFATSDGARTGIIVRSFADAVTESEDFAAVPGRQLQEGAVTLVRSDPGYQARDHTQHSLPRVRTALEALESQFSVELSLPFLQLLWFDAWIGNTDRHQHNWAVLWQDGRPSLAPVYDPAACLGVELTPDYPLLTAAEGDPTRARRLEKYIRGAPSGFGDGQRLIPLTSVVAGLNAWNPGSEYVHAWLATFQAAMDTSVVKFLTSIPESWLPTPRQKLAALLLTERLRWLKSQVQDGTR